ncbi:MAG: hypothetical protein NW217_00220 [Hyphomicrobiaceae bacterium]|nr:hypothetical protein [Hyphomicrobiaceae bacterium]
MAKNVATETGRAPNSGAARPSQAEQFFRLPRNSPAPREETPSSEQEREYIGQKEPDSASIISAVRRLTLEDILSLIDPRDDDPARRAIREIAEARISGKFKSATIQCRSIYDDRQDGESVEDFVRRRFPEIRKYRGKSDDGDVITFIREEYGSRGLLDGQLFTRAVLRRLDPAAEKAVQNWLTANDYAAYGIQLPRKQDSVARLAEQLTIDEMRAARARSSRGRHRD